jgi:hypothetical protein
LTRLVETLGYRVASDTHGEGIDSVEDGVVASFLKNDRELVVGELNTYKGKRYAHVRILVPSAVEDDWIHTENGVAIEADRVDELKSAVGRLSEVASRDIVVGRVPVDREEIRVGVNPFRGEAYAYVRRFYQKKGEWAPTRKGISIRVDLVPELVKLVDALASAAGAQSRSSDEGETK